MGTPDLRGEVAAAVRALARLQSRTLPVKAGARAVALVKERFREEGFAGQKWQEPFRRRLSFRGAEGRNRTLTGLTGHLRDSTYAQPYPGKSDWLDRLLNSNYVNGYIDAQARQALGPCYEPVMLLRNIEGQAAIQARIPFIPNIR